MSANILKEVAHPRTRIMPLEERDRMQAKIVSEKLDMDGKNPEFTQNREVMKHIIKNPPGANESSQNENQVNIKRMEAILKRQGGRPLTKQEMVLLEKRSKVLIAEMRKLMVPVEDTLLSPSLPGGAANPEFQRAKNEMARGEMSQKFREKAHELKNILRLLGKDDPNAGNFENFRPRRGEV